MSETAPEGSLPAAATVPQTEGGATQPKIEKSGAVPPMTGLTETQSLRAPGGGRGLVPGSPEATAELTELVRFGRYRVDARLGSGGFGTVYKGYDEELHREVAVKVPHRHLIVSPADVDAYLAEARVLASLDHPGIVPVYDVGRTSNGLCYLVSKFIQGYDLARRIKQGRLSCIEVANLIAAVAEALHHAHRRGLVHRDIKPANILIEPSGKPVVVDFGLALRDEDYGTGPTCPGTPAYMSPEEAREEGHLVDARTDVYSLGVVLYELLAGQRPFRADDLVSLRDEIKKREPRPPRQVSDAVPRELDRICLKALSKRVSDRYSTALDMAEDLRHWLAEQSTQSARAAPLDPLPGGEAPPSGPSSAMPPESASTQTKVLPKGLRSFDAEDADFFLTLLPGPRGRDGLPDSVRFWKSRLETTDPDRAFRMGLVYGPSGCGKSSLIKAGLLPRLAEHVWVVYVEATPGETEARLLRALRQRCPGLPDDLSLVESLTQLRRGRGLPDGRKVVLLLDQFEQWLHATREQQELELIQALRQCDGRRVQCVILVRDEYWMSTTRFMRALEVPLQEGENSLAVDLFDPRHARKVLAGFGRSFGALAEGTPAPEQERFLEQAVAQLSQEDKVVPVRLSLFAEMVKGRSWTAATLKEVGGAEGLGVTFLEETFSAPTAPPEHRLHQRAARAVLRELLPEQGTDLKGRMQPYGKLLEASGYANSPRDFDELLHILDAELRLVTPADRDGTGEAGPGAALVDPPERYYQLTHDYLVHALRQWLTAKQRETRRGRAELRLAEQAALWTIQPQNRCLPSGWEWAQIHLLARRVPWNESERRMMAAATRHHIRRGIVVATLLLLAVLAGVYVTEQIEERHQAAQADALLSRLLVADIGQVQGIIASLEGYRDRTDPELARIASDPERPPSERLRASLALVPVDDGQVPYLVERLLTAVPDELLVIRGLLRPHSGQLVDPLWLVVKEGVSCAGRNLRAACALAAYAPEDNRWDGAARPIATELVRVDPLLLRQWTTALHPVRKRLLTPLGAIYRGESQDTAERAMATSILADYAADNPAFLVELIKDADVRQYTQLIGKLEDCRSEAVASMAEELTRSPLATAPEGENERLGKRQANAAVTLFRMGEFQLVWPLLKHSPDPRVRSRLIHALSPLGANPAPLVERWGVEPIVSARRALLLCLGEFGGDRLPAGVRELAAALALRAYDEDPDPGIHSAAEWLLRTWGAEGELRQSSDRLKGRTEDPGRAWYDNREGHTMVVTDGRNQPVEFSAGKKVERRFAIATKEVTVAQFLRFRPEHRYDGKPAAGPDYPVNGVTWYDAARYCRWLSEQEHIPDNQMCYPPIEEIKPGMKPYPDYLSRTGYRLPTEAEWELACRAGTATPWFFGASEELLAHYAWYNGNSSYRLHPVGRKKPNDFGLFDTLGNAMEWCQDAKNSFEKTGLDREDTDAVRNDVVRAARGGTHHQRPQHTTATHRDPLVPETPWYSISFRIARSCPLGR